MIMAKDSTSRNLLLGPLALQNDFIDREALLTAFNAWIADRSRPLGQVLAGVQDMRRHIEETGSFIAADERGSRHWPLVFTEYVRDLKAGKGGTSGAERATSIQTAE